MVDKQKAISLRLIGKTYKEISSELNCSVDWCKQNLKEFKKPKKTKCSLCGK